MLIFDKIKLMSLEVLALVVDFVALGPLQLKSVVPFHGPMVQSMLQVTHLFVVFWFNWYGQNSNFAEFKERVYNFWSYMVYIIALIPSSKRNGKHNCWVIGVFNITNHLLIYRTVTLSYWFKISNYKATNTNILNIYIHRSTQQHTHTNFISC